MNSGYTRQAFERVIIMKFHLFLLVFLLFGLACGFPTEASAARFQLTPQEVDEALQRGRNHAKDPAKLFESYSFGTLGVETNGYVLTKTLELALLAATEPGIRATDRRVKQIVAKDHLVMPVYLLHTDPSRFKQVKITLRQGINTLKPAKILFDEPKKAHCQDKTCVYTCDLFPGFFYKDLEPGLMLVLVVEFDGKIQEFRVPFGNLK